MAPAVEVEGLRVVCGGGLVLPAVPVGAALLGLALGAATLRGRTP